MTADDDVKWISHSVDVNDYVEWTVRARVVQTDCGGRSTDNIT